MIEAVSGKTTSFFAAIGIETVAAVVPADLVIDRFDRWSNSMDSVVVATFCHATMAA